MKHLLMITIAALLPSLAFAAGSSSSTTTPPPKTETTVTCEEGMVYDVETEMCVAPTEGQQSGVLTEEELKQAVREFAYAGQYGHAQSILRLLDQGDDMVQTYWGFTTRKQGDFDGGMAFYQAALTLNPDNLLARSYMGQAKVEVGDIDGAMIQLAQINARGGKATWPAIALKKAIQSGTGYSY